MCRRPIRLCGAAPGRSVRMPAGCFFLFAWRIAHRDRCGHLQDAVGYTPTAFVYPPAVLPPPFPFFCRPVVGAMSSGKPDQSQDPQTWSCGLMVRPQPRASCLRLGTTAHLSMAPPARRSGCHCLPVSADTPLTAACRVSVPPVRTMHCIPSFSFFFWGLPCRPATCQCGWPGARRLLYPLGAPLSLPVCHGAGLSGRDVQCKR